MKLPAYAAQCIDALESAGFAAYLVGGCVRDDLMGIEPHDYDLCTDALPEETEAVFRDFPLDLTGVKHGTVRVNVDGETVEITTFRREGAYLDNRHPDWVEFVKDIRQDLARRDFTVNAIAWSPIRGYVDPFGGREDVQKSILRAVGDPRTRFREDSLRILRGIRFAARFRLDAAPETMAAMTELAPLTDNLARERVFDELSGFLLKASAADLARFAPVVTTVIPELAPAVGFDQHSPHHAYDVYTHTALVTQSMPADLSLRWAALLHDIGKVPCFTQDANGRGHFKGHAAVGAEMADAVLLRLRAPKEVREEAVWMISRHMTVMDPDRKLLRRMLSACGRDTLERLFLLQEADMRSKGTTEHQASVRFPRMREMLADLEATEGRITLRSLAVNGTDLAQLGFTGKAIGTTLNRLLDQVLDEQLPNERTTLLNAAKEY